MEVAVVALFAFSSEELFFSVSFAFDFFSLYVPSSILIGYYSPSA